MYIVYDTNNAIDSLRCKYLVLETDTIEFSDGNTVKTFAIIDSTRLSLDDMLRLESLTDLHENLIKNYRLQNWDYCTQAIEHLTGGFNGEMDSFYSILLARICDFKTSDMSMENWTGHILTTQTD